MKGPSSPNSFHFCSESPRTPPLKWRCPSVPPSGFPTSLVPSSSMVEPRVNSRKRARQATSNGEAFPYQCNCGKKFRTAQEYGGHQNAHTRPKKFMNKCLERVRSNYLMLPGYSVPPNYPTFLQEEVGRLKQRQKREDTGFVPILRPMEKVCMHPYRSNRSLIDKNTGPPNPCVPFNSFDAKVLEFCRTSHERNGILSPRNLVPLGNAGLVAKNATAYLLKASSTTGVVNLDLASRKFVSFWNPDHGSENSMLHRGAGVIMRESAPRPPACGNSGGNVLTCPGLAPGGVRHVEDDNPSGLDLELHL